MAGLHRVALHVLCRVHGVAPDVVDKFVGTEHAGDQRPGVETDAQLEWLPGGPASGVYGIEHRQRHLGHRHGVVGSLLGQPAGHQIAVTTGLNLLEPVPGGESVEPGKKVPKQLHRLLR